MMEKGIYFQKIQLRPRNFGYSNVADVKIKVQYKDEKELDEFISFIKKHPRVVEFFSIAGEYDFSLVLIAKDAIDLGDITSNIRGRFGGMITAWNVSLTIKSYKFEEYDMLSLYDEG